MTRAMTRGDQGVSIVELPMPLLPRQTVHSYEYYFDERRDPTCSLVVAFVEKQPVVPWVAVVEAEIQ